MPLVIRELLAGSCHFADLRRAIPLISPATLSQRLHELMDAGVIERTRAGAQLQRVEYRLTDAGRELQPIIREFGIWGQRWARDVRPGEIDPEVLAWVMHRRLDFTKFPVDRAVILFEFPDVEIKLRRFWLIIDHGHVDVCLKNPGYDVDLSLVTSIRTMAMIYLGQVEPDVAVRSGLIALDGSRALARTFPTWCPRSSFAAAARPAVLPAPMHHSARP